VVLGQDPYFNPGEAMGLSFSVPPGVKIPSSLRNIYKWVGCWGLAVSRAACRGVGVQRGRGVGREGASCVRLLCASLDPDRTPAAPQLSFVSSRELQTDLNCRIPTHGNLEKVR